MRHCSYRVPALVFYCVHIAVAVPPRPAEETCSSSSTCATAGEEAEALLQRKWQGRPEARPEAALAELSHWPPKAVVSEDMDLLGMRGIPPTEDHEGWLPASEAFDDSGMDFGDARELAGGVDVFGDLQREQARAERNDFAYSAPDDTALRMVNRAPQQGTPGHRETEDRSAEDVPLEDGAPGEGVFDGAAPDDTKFYRRAPDGAEDGASDGAESLEEAGPGVEAEEASAPSGSLAGAEGKATLVADAMTCPPEFEDGRMNWPNMTLEQCVDYCASTPSPCSFFTLAGNASCTVFKQCPDLVAVKPSGLPARTFKANATAMQGMEVAPVPLGNISPENASGNSTGGDSNESGAAPLNDSAPSLSSDSEVGVVEAPSNISVSKPPRNVSEANISNISEAKLSNNSGLPSESITDVGGDLAWDAPQNSTLEDTPENVSAKDATPLDPDNLFWNTTTPMPVGGAPVSGALESARDGASNGTVVTSGSFPVLPPSNESAVEPDGAEAEATEEMLRPRFSYRRHVGQYLYGFADGDASPLSEEEAQARCDELGQGCGGFTCLTTTAETICTVRAGSFPLPSEKGETSYLQLCPTPTNSASMGDYRDCLMEKCQDADPSFLADAESITLATPSCMELSADCDAALSDGTLVKHLCPMACSACAAPAEGYRLGPETIPPLGSDSAQAPAVIVPYDAGEAPSADRPPLTDEEGNATAEPVGDVVPWGNNSSGSSPGNDTLSPSASGGPAEVLDDRERNASNASSVNASAPATASNPANASATNATLSEDPCEIDTKMECSDSMIPFVSVSCPDDRGSMTCDGGGTCFCESGCWVGDRCEPRRTAGANGTVPRSLLATHGAGSRLPSLHGGF